jgi:hypothetical protein
MRPATEKVIKWWVESEFTAPNLPLFILCKNIVYNMGRIII